MINKRLKAISLFSGAMGLDLGIEKAGIEIKLCVELNKQAVATIRNNTVTAGLLKTYVPNWEDKTLVGKELWDFISEIEDKIAELIEVFHTNYNSLSEYYESLW